MVLLEVLGFIAGIVCLVFFLILFVEWIVNKPSKEDKLSYTARYQSANKLRKFIEAIEKSGTTQFHLQNAEISESEWQEVKSLINNL